MANIVEITIRGVDQTRGLFRNIAKDLSQFTNIAGAATVGLAALTGAAAVGAGVLGHYVSEAITTADEMGRMAQKAGIAVEDFTAFTHAVKLADVSNEDLVRGLKSLSQNLVQTGRGGTNLVEEMLRISDQFAAMQDGAQKTALAVQIFGKSGQQLIPLLNQGSAALREQIQEAKEFGLVIDQETARAADEFKDNMVRLDAILRGFGLTIAKEILPSLVKLSEQFVTWAKNSDAVKESLTGIAGVLSSLSGSNLVVDKILGGLKSGTLNFADKLIPKGEVIPNEDIDKATQLLDQLILKRYQVAQNGLAAFKEEEITNQKRIQQINDLVVADGVKNNLIYENAQLHQASLTAIEQQQSDARIAIIQREKDARMANYQAVLGATAGLFGNLGALAATYGKKGFALQQAFASAQAVVQTAAGVARALADWPWPYSIVVGGLVAAAGAVQLATIANTKPGGQAHGGLDFVPRESTFLLQRGERVIQPQQNVRLERLLDAFDRGGFGGGGTIVVELGGREVGRAIYDLTRDGLATVHSRSVRDDPP